MNRNEKGHFAPGTMDEALRQAISRGQAERHAKAREAMADAPAVESKVCTVCGLRKKVPDDYSMRKRTLKSGVATTYPSPECKKCARKRAERWKAAYIEEHGVEAYKALQAKWNKKRSKAAKRKYNREYQRLQSALANGGQMPLGPRKKYAHEAGGGPSPRVDPQPFLDWWDRLNGERPVVESHEKDAMTLRRLRSGATKTVSLDFVDRMALRVGRPDIARRLYPDV